MPKEVRRKLLYELDQRRGQPRALERAVASDCPSVLEGTRLLRRNDDLCETEERAQLLRHRAQRRKESADVCLHWEIEAVEDESAAR